MSTHWAIRYVGFRWVNGARGPGEYDCWGLYAWCSWMHFGHEVPAYAGIDALNDALVGTMINKAAGTGEWAQLTEPVDGCAVIMSKRGDGSFHHVGIYADVDGGLVLHATPPRVVAQTLAQLRSLGYGRIEFYSHGTHHRTV